MINAIITGIFKILIKLISILLTPIDSLITSLLPDVSLALNSIGGFLSQGFSLIGWGISALGIPQTAISILILYYGVKLTVPLAMYLIKLAIRWYNSLKL